MLLDGDLIPFVHFKSSALSDELQKCYIEYKTDFQKACMQVMKSTLLKYIFDQA
jgi:hypothetical protein